VNLSRVRHAEQIKDTVDVEIILADTIRIGTDDMVLKSARAAVAHHGAANVKLVATKIDVRSLPFVSQILQLMRQSLNKNQLSQCHGADYDEIQRLLQFVEEQEAELDDDDDDGPDAKKRTLLSRYKKYLERTRKQRKISDRAKAITKDLATKLQGRSMQDSPAVMHASASEYMEWIRKSKLNYNNQPDLPVEMTGVPDIREFLLSLPAQQNLQDYQRHVNITIPAFFEKIKRTVSEDDRDGGFKTIADEFDRIRQGFMSRLLTQAKSAFQTASKNSISKATKDIGTFREQVEELLSGDWLLLKSAAFTRILKHRGNVAKGVSRARGLENGSNWNKDLANTMAPGFHRWSKSYTDHMKPMAPALRIALDQLHDKITKTISDCAANLVTVEKAQKKWRPMRLKLQSKLAGLTDEIAKHQRRTLEWATMEFDCENNLISHVTDEIFDKVFHSAPALKPPNPKHKKPMKQYVEPKLKFQKKKLEELFLLPDNHFVDRVFSLFQTQFDKAIQKKSHSQ
jgi:hypothetical protein